MNRKLILFVLCLLVSLSASAQTNFRSISYKEALAAAMQEGKMVFIDFYTDWCGPCKRMARETFPQKAVGEYMNEAFVNIQINAEKGEGVALADQYKVTAYPTFIVTDALGQETGRSMGFKDGDAFVIELQKMRNPELRADRLVARYNAGERSAQLIQAYAAYIKDQRVDQDFTREDYFKTQAVVNKIVQDYFDGLTDAEKLSKENLFVYRSYTASTDEAPARYMVANRSKFDTSLTQDVDSILHELYLMQIYRYLSGDEPYDAVKVKALQKEARQQRVDTDGKFDVAFRFLKPEVQQVKGLVEVVDKYFLSLDEYHQAALMDGMSRRFTSVSQDDKNQLAGSLRRQLPKMSVESMFTAVMLIPELEGTSGHQ